MRKLVYAVMLLVCFGALSYAEDSTDSTSTSTTTSSTLMGVSGDWSYGVVSVDALTCFDIIQVNDISSRTGASLTFVKYKKFDGYIGAAAPASDPASVAAVGGVGVEFNKVAKTGIVSALQAIGVSSISIESAIDKAVRLRANGGYDLRNHGFTLGIALGWAFSG